MRELANFLRMRIAEDQIDLERMDATFGIGRRWVGECEVRFKVVDLIAVAPLADELEGAGVLQTMALPYSDHRDYQQDWRV